VYKSVGCIVLQHLEVKSCRKGDNRTKTSSCKRCSIDVFVVLELLISAYDEACLALRKEAVLIELISIYLRTI
jgi:hypothetical protein